MKPTLDDQRALPSNAYLWLKPVAVAVFAFAFVQIVLTFNHVRDLSQDRAVLATPLISEDDLSLIDIVLAIAPRYYVEKDKWNNSSLIFKDLLQSLASRTSFHFSARLLDENRYAIEVRGQELGKIDQPNSFPELKQSLLKLAALLKDSAGLGSQTFVGISGLLDLVLRSMDPHSSLLDAQAYEDLKQGTEGHFGGLGVLVGIRDKLLTVLKPMLKSPAERAGVRSDEAIIAINEKPTFGVNLDDLITEMRGPPGSVVELTLLDRMSKKSRSLRLAREIIDVSPVQSELLKLGQRSILHLSIDSFSKNTAKEVRQHLKAALASAPQGIILDLRSNPGGLLDQAIEAADVFLKEGIIVITKDGQQESVETATDDGDETHLPIAVLLDGQSASASEILAGALKDHGRALILGQPSFGKGSVQTVFELPGDRALKLTVARYYTPSGVSIQNTGIDPDIFIQPILLGEAKENPFGIFHLEREAELANHLENRAKRAQEQNRSKPIYYLSQGLSSKNKLDYELELAQKVLAKAISVGGTNQAVLERSSFLEAAAAPLISQVREEELNKIEETSSAVKTWTLRSKNLKPHVSIPMPQLSAEISLSPEDKRQLIVSWQIKNPGKQALDHLSLVVRFKGGKPVDAFEFLIPALKPTAELQGQFKKRLMEFPGQGTFTANIGLFKDMDFLTDTENQVSFQASKPTTTQIAISGQILNQRKEEVRSLVEGEDLLLEVQISNVGENLLEKALMDVLDLNGEIVALDTGRISLSKKLSPGEDEKFYLPLKVSSLTSIKKLYFGVNVESSSLEQDVETCLQMDRSNSKDMISQRLSPNSKVSNASHAH